MGPQEIIFNVKTNTGNSASDVNKVDKALKDTSTSAKTLSADYQKSLDEIKAKVESGTLTQRQLTRAVKEYQTVALQAGETSPVGQQAIAEAGQLKDRLGDLQNSVNVLGHDGANMQAALQLGTTVTAGYGAFKGVTALLGKENEDLTKTLVKLEAVQVTLASVEQIRAALEKESFLMIKLRSAATVVMTVVQNAYTLAVGTTTGAMKLLRIAMLAIPIVALVAGIIAIVAVVKELTAETENLEESNDRLTESFDRQAAAADRASEKLIRGIENRIRMAELNGASATELAALEIEKINAVEAARRNSIKREIALGKERADLARKALERGETEQFESFKKQVAASVENVKNLRALDGQAEADRAATRKKASNEEADSRKEANDKAKQERNRAAEERKQEELKRAQESLNLQRQFSDLSIANIPDQEVRERTALAEKHRRELEDLRKQFGERKELIAQLTTNQMLETQALEDELSKARTEKEAEKLAAEKEAANVSAKAELEAKLINARDEFEASQALKLELAQLELEQELQKEGLTNGEKLKIQAEYDEKVAGLDEERKTREEQTNQAIIASRQALAGAIAGVLGQLAGLAKEGSATAKVLALAEIGINTAVGFVNGLRIAQESAEATGPGAAFAFPIFYATQIGAVLAAAAKAKSILKSGPSISAPSASSGGGSSGAVAQVPTLGSNTTTSTSSLPGSPNYVPVLVTDSFNKVNNQSEQAKGLATVVQ